MTDIELRERFAKQIVMSSSIVSRSNDGSEVIKKVLVSSIK